MKIGIIGSGVVGQTLGGKLAERGHQVVLGTRDPKNLDEKRGYGDSLAEWLEKAGRNARVATFEDAARHGEVVINATAGTASLKALEAAGKANLNGKILIDVANPLDFSKGMPPTLTVCNTDSLGEQVQRAFPDAKVVKTLNTVNASVMVAPERVARGDHALFVCGDDPAAKAQVTRHLHDWFGWSHDSIVDLGGIEAARGTEMILPLWVRLMGVLGSPMFNFRIVR
ncbi:MAG TPA: NAD(P)-binding domain-containing protein [Gemmatimonadota bacterium]|nr:NAD(P)-binding domain-containing protein [Gemmatimonadota bacterium]